MGSPEKPVDVEMGDMSESAQLNPDPEKPAEDKNEKSARFTGLTKEELLEISAQPGWVRARWCLFILFWLVWVGMLVGAIVIVIQAPRCKPNPELTWYQSEVGYVVNDKFGDASQHLDYVKDLSAKAVIVTGKDGPDDAFSALLTSKSDKQYKGFKVVAEVALDTSNTANAQIAANKWVEAGADGVMISGLGAVNNETALTVANDVWEAIKNETQIALYLESSNMDIAHALYRNNNLTTTLLSAPFSDCVGQTNAGKCLKDALRPYRADDRNVVGYMLPSDFNMSAYQSGLNLMMLGLPGVTIIRSADEFGGHQADDFTWEENESNEMKPARSLGDDGKAVLSTFKKFSPKKAPGIEQESSLRFDAFDGTEWKYVGAETDTSSFAFCRKWDAKPTVLIVSNMSPEEIVVDATGCLMEDEKNIEKAKPTDYSGEVEGEELDLTKLTVASGQTLVFKN